MESSLYFIIHHTPTSSQNKLDLLSSPAHSDSKSSEICLGILITLCLHRNEKSNTHTCTHGDFFFFFFGKGAVYCISNGCTVSHISARFTARGRAINVTPAPPKGKAKNNKCCFSLLLFSFASEIKTCSAENQIKDASPWQIATLIIYLSEHNHRRTGEKETQTLDTGGWQSGSAV